MQSRHPLTSLVCSKYRPKVKRKQLKMSCKHFFLSAVSWSCYSADDCCRSGRICVLKKIRSFMNTHSPKAKFSPRR